jgi:hypothetical protein
MKTITLENSTWKMLTKDKLDLDCKTIDEVINRYKIIITKISNDKVINWTDEVRALKPLPTGNNQEFQKEVK